MNIRQAIHPTGFLKNVLTLMSGTALAQAIPLLVSPVLSRLFAPEDFGLLGLFLSLVAVLAVVSTGRYELAIVLPGDEKEAVNILALSLALVLFTSLCSLILVILFGAAVAVLFGEPAVAPYLYLVPASVFFLGIFQSFNFWSTRQKTFRRNAVSRVLQTSGNAAVSVGAGYLGVVPAGLIVGSVAGNLVGAMVIVVSFLKKLTYYRKLVSWQQMKDAGRKYRNFLRINTPHAFIDTLQDHGIVYFILYFFDKFILGSYSFAFRILKAPVGLIGGAVNQVFYQKASQAASLGEDIRPMVRKIYLNLFMTGFPLFVALFLFTPEIFSFVFGKDYHESGKIARILIPWIFMNFMASPVSCIVLVMNRQKEAMYFTFADIGFKVAAIVVGGINSDYRLGFVIMSILCSGLLIYGLFWYHKIAGGTARGYS